MDYEDLPDIDPYLNCFLCGIKLTKSNITEEHIFGEWILKEYSLYNQTIELMNGQTFLYRNLKIPCCNICNNERLSALELKVSTAVKQGFEAFIAVPKNQINAWLGKIYMGILIKETELRFNIKDINSHAIHEKEIISRKYINFLIIRSHYHKTIFENEVSSTFIFRMNKKTKYWYYSNPDSNSIVIIMGEIGIILFLQDGGIINEYFSDSKLNDIKDRELDISELLEIYSRLLYFNERNDYVPIFRIEGNLEDKRTKRVRIMNPYDQVYINFDEYNEEILGDFIRYFLSMVFPVDKVLTFKNGYTLIKELVVKE